jgi:transcriptional regulator with XRE-family HTH domain
MDVKATQKADFADRLKAAIDQKGWSMSETARRASSFLNQGEKFGRAHVWHYVQGRALPRFRYLEALSLALDLRPDDLMPAEPESEKGRTRVGPSATAAKGIRVPSVEKAPQVPFAPPAPGSGMVHVRDYGDGTALLEVSERVPWTTALAVLQILKRTPG